MTTPIPPSTVATIKGALFDLLSARMAGPGVLVAYDSPGTYQPEDIVCVGDVHRQIAVHAAVGSGGAGWLDETYTVHVIVECYRGGDNARLVFERAAALAAVAESAVRADPSIGGLALVARPVGVDYTSDAEEDHKGRTTRADLRIEVYALT
ncbi:hypothetical protein Lfu02_17670 [Longispora fulva]|uniref:Uncharacterized protein n=1 Tax=Longispora fulva TaxID=619741 RepID=A0A8J7GNH5_9ACTN|nr:hypothetical protein [Longispora fulva]MBG6140228.1 hypothetical protein [Longispora fulva]GIG57395.1 hypothetical protein Lfu02_17670 [Longispora fulva]